MMKFGYVFALLVALGLPCTAKAQTQPGSAGQQVASDAERAARRFRVGVEGGVGLDPQILVVGAHATFGPIFRPNFHFRPGVEIGGGEITTVFGINLDLLYNVPGISGDARWMPYVGAGPTFGLSHRGFETDEIEDERNRFDFSDTDFNAGMNFIVGMRRPGGGMFFEMKATAWGVSNVKLLLGTTF